MLGFLRKLFCPELKDAGELRERLDALATQLSDFKERLRVEESLHGTTKNNLVNALHEEKQLRDALSLHEAPAVFQVPVFLDTSKPPYLPAIAVPDSDESVQVFDATAVYLPSDRDRLETAPWKNLPKAEKLRKVWDLVIKRVKYVADSRDNWQPPYVTRFRQRGDCEDSTAWLIALCRAAGLRADEVFNAVGPSKFGYHSYPIVFLSADDADALGAVGEGSGWFVFESTLDVMPVKPLKLVGSPYWVDDGLANWRFAGQIKPVFLGEFNGAAPASIPGAELIENSEDKAKKIRKFYAELV